MIMPKDSMSISTVTKMKASAAFRGSCTRVFMPRSLLDHACQTARQTSLFVAYKGLFAPGGWEIPDHELRNCQCRFSAGGHRRTGHGILRIGGRAEDSAEW